jgi:arylsulfatase A-like enzyme
MSTPYWGPFTQQPNLLIFVTDQQRTAQHLPAGWVQNNLPNLWKLMSSGVTFVNGMTNTTACSPARATLWTSSFPMVNGVKNVGQTLDMTKHANLTTLGLALTQYAPAGITYDVVYKGRGEELPTCMASA